MPIKLFLLGRPGCGKSSATRHIIKHLQNKRRSIKRFKDFDILKEMSSEEQYKQDFKATLYDGFDVVNEYVFDEALKELETRLHRYISKAGVNKIIIVEFARNDYVKAFQYFSSFVLNDAHVLLIDTDLDECIERVKRRMDDPKSDDDHYVSEEAIQKFYAEQVLPDSNMLLGKFEKIDNNGTFPEFIAKIDNFVKDIIK